MADLNDEVNAISDHLRRLNHEFDRYANLTSQSTDAVRQRSAAEKYRDQQLEQSGRAAADSLKDFGKAVGTYTSAMYQGNNGAAALNTTITQVTSGLGNLAISLAALVTPGGVVKKVLAAGLAAVGIEALKISNDISNAGREMVDAQYKSYSDMAKSGAVADEGMRGVADGAQKLGLNILEMDKYLGLIAGNSGSLAMLGKSAANGRRRFEDIGEELKSSRGMFKALGMDQDAVNEGQMGYLRLLTRTGQVQQQSAKELAAGVKSYLIEQDALTKLTGTSRKEAEDIKARALADERFRASIDEMIANGDTAGAKNAQDFNAMLEKIAPERAAGYRAAFGGGYNTKEAQQFLQATNGQADAIIQLSKSIGVGAGDLLADELRKNTEMVQPLAKLGASNSTFGNYAQNRDFVEFQKSKGPGGIAGAQAEILKQIAGQTGTVGPDGKMGEQDPRLKRQVELLDMQQETNMLLQQLINQNLDDLKIGGKAGADYAQIEAINYEKFARARLLEYVKAANPELYKKYQTEKSDQVKQGAMSEETAKGLMQASEKQIAALDQNRSEIAEALRKKEAEKTQAQQRVDRASQPESAKIEAKRELEKRLAEFEQLKLQLERNVEAKNRAVQDKATLEKQLKDLKDGRKPVTETAKDPKAAEAAAAESAKAEAAKAEAAKAAKAKAADDPEARARARMEKELADKKAAGKATEKSETPVAKPEEKKSEAKETATAKITLLPNGARVLDDVLELVKKGVPVISNVRTKEEQEALVDHTDEKGNRFTKNNLPVADDSKHLTGDAIDVRVKDMTKDLEKLLTESGWMRPLPKSDPGHWQRAPKPKESKKTSGVAPNDIDLATALSKNLDLSDATAGLTINSDVATLNSKGMNMTLANSDEVTKMIALAMAPVEDSDLSRRDQSAAKASFESSMGDVRSTLAEQKATNMALLDAMQELIRIQKNGVDVQQKIYRATV